MRKTPFEMQLLDMEGDPPETKALKKAVLEELGTKDLFNKAHRLNTKYRRLKCYLRGHVWECVFAIKERRRMLTIHMCQRCGRWFIESKRCT